MRRTPVISAASAAIVLLAPAAPSQAAPTFDKINGTAVLGQFGNPTAHVNAVQTPAGLTGGFTITYPDGTSVAGTNRCLVVTGDTAYVTATITRATGPRQAANNWNPGGYIVLGMRDTGEPGTAGPDKLNFSPGFTNDPGCGFNWAAYPVIDIVRGNYQVADAA
jgi:hypothetical protein